MTEPTVIPGDQCDTCHTDYQITADNAILYCFIDCPKADHIQVKCPNGHEENIFVCADAFLHVLKECHLNVLFARYPSDAFMDQCLEALDEDDELVHTSESDGPANDVGTIEIDPPHYLLRELYDQMREYETTN